MGKVPTSVPVGLEETLSFLEDLGMGKVQWESGVAEGLE
jgi:hypothetical protein